MIPAEAPTALHVFNELTTVSSVLIFSTKFVKTSMISNYSSSSFSRMLMRSFSGRSLIFSISTVKSALGFLVMET